MDKPQENNNAVLEVKALSTCFGSRSKPDLAVNEVCFSIEKGECHALVGESGSGKSISALSVLRLLPTTAFVSNGEVLFEGTNLLALQEQEMRSIRGRGISMIFQEPMTSLNPVMTIGQQIGEVIHQRNSTIKNGELRKEVIELLDSVGIPNPEGRINDYPHQLSGGQKQRVMIAIAIANKPKLLIADEPTTALDVTIQKQVLQLIKELQEKLGMAILFITHDLALVNEFADSVSVMKQGKIVEQAKVDDFFQNAQHPYSHQLFAAIPSAEKRGSRLASGESSNDTTSNKIAKTIKEDTVLAVENLKVHFPIRRGVFRRVVGHVKAVDGVNFSIKKAETLALVGESGCGKTTVGKAILRLINATDGNIQLNEQDLLSLNNKELLEKRRDLQIIFQDPFSSMNPRMLVGDIIAEGMKALGKGDSQSQRWETATQLLTEVGLPENSVRRYPHEFSGGQRQRICIARALSVDPKLIICDEPTSALDVSVQAQILNLLSDLQTTKGISFLFITHDMSVVSYFADRVAVMNQGVIVEQGEVSDIMNNPKEAYTQRLLDAVPAMPSMTASV